MKSTLKNILKSLPSKKPSKVKKMPLGEEVKILRKENELLKKDLSSIAIEKFKTRRSVRKFSDTPVDFKVICDIIEAGLNGPVAGNIQNYKIIVIENKESKTECSKIAMQQYWVSQAPYLLIVTRDDSELISLYPQRGELYSIQNCAAVIENILMAANFYGLGACWVDANENDILKDYLGVPPHSKIDAIIPVGYPLENPQVRKNPLVAMVYFEKWGKKNK